MTLKKVITFVLALAILTPVFPVLAEDGEDDNETSSTFGDRREDRMENRDDRRASSTERREDRMEDRDDRRASSTERREDRMEDRDDRRASSTERRIEMQQGLAKKKAENTAKRLTATVERLDKIITRLESRIVKVESQGGTTTDAKIFVAEARGYLAQASTSIATFKDLTFTDDKARENFEKVRTLAKEVKEYLRNAHNSLIKAARSLKGQRKDNYSTSTSEKLDD